MRGKILGSDHYGARPNLGVNAIEVAATFASQVAESRADPQVSHSAKFTKLPSGSGNLNGIPRSVSFGIDLRAQTNDAMAQLRKGVRRIGSCHAELYGSEIVLEAENFVPAAFGGEETEALLAASIERTADGLAPPRAVTSGSDDFHCYTLRRPELQAAMLAVGADVTPGLHDSAMRYDVSRLGPAATVMVQTCLAAR